MLPHHSNALKPTPWVPQLNLGYHTVLYAFLGFLFPDIWKSCWKTDDGYCNQIKSVSSTGKLCGGSSWEHGMMRSLPTTPWSFSVAKKYPPPNLWCEMSWSEAQLNPNPVTIWLQNGLLLITFWLNLRPARWGPESLQHGRFVGILPTVGDLAESIKSMLIRRQPLDRVRSKATDLARRLSECLCLWGALMSFSLVWKSSLIGTDKFYRTNPCDRGMCSILMHVLIFFDIFFKMIHLNSPGGL